jgi:mannan endo-1,6-alpha-mannosidase
MTALETIQALLAFDAQPPFKFGEIKHVKSKDESPSDAPTAAPSTTQQPDSIAHAITAGYTSAFVVLFSFTLFVYV